MNNLMQPESSAQSFTFLPLHRVYTFESGGIPTRTSVMVEVNLPSGIKSDKFWVEVVDCGMILQVTVEWPDYMLDPAIFNASWLKQSDLLLQSSRITSSSKSVQDIRRRFGGIAVKSTAHISLPRKVDEDISSLQMTKLGFRDSTECELKANGLAIQVQLLAVEELSMKHLPHATSSSFTIVESRNCVTSALSASIGSSSVTH